MPYVGNIPAESYAAFDVQYFTTSATTSYTLDHAVANELDIRLVINNVIQEPGSGKAYTASGTTLTLSGATAGTDTMYCVYTGKASQTVNPPAGSVGTSQLADDAVTTIKINDDAVNSAKLSSTAVDNTNTNSTLITAQTAKTSLVDADKFLISDSAASGALKYVENQYLGGGTHVKLLSGSVSSATNHDFQNFVDTSKYNYYLVQISNALGMGTYSPFSLQARTSSGPHTGSNYSFASYGYRSSGNTTHNYGENQGRTLLGTGITGVANKPSGLMFYMVVNPSANAGGTHGWGINWGWNTTNSDIQWENFSYMVEYTGTTTGFRLYADSNNATTFDYAIYGIAK